LQIAEYSAVVIGMLENQESLEADEVAGLLRIAFELQEAGTALRDAFREAFEPALEPGPQTLRPDVVKRAAEKVMDDAPGLPEDLTLVFHRVNDAAQDQRLIVRGWHCRET
jgi:hypothetical protein